MWYLLVQIIITNWLFWDGYTFGRGCCCCWLPGGDRFLSHHELRHLVGPVLNPYPHNGVCVCVCIGTRPRCPHMHVHMSVVSSHCPVYFSSPATLRLPSRTLVIPSQPTHTGLESVDQWSRIPKWHSGRTHSQPNISRAILPWRKRVVTNATSVTQDTAEPSFLPGINSLCQFTVPQTIFRSPVPITPMWVKLTTVASQLASRSLGYRE